MDIFSQILDEAERLNEMKLEAQRVVARLKELGHKYDFILMSKDIVYAVGRDELLYREGLATYYEKKTYSCFNWVGCKKEIESHLAKLHR